MPPSLSSKLRDFRRTLRSKFKANLIIDTDHLKSIAKHMPKTSAELCNLGVPVEVVDAYGDKILEITAQHSRDQEAFNDCVQEIKAFTRGGDPGMECLKRVYTQIIKHFGMENETEEVFEACDIYIDTYTGKNSLKRKRGSAGSEYYFGNQSHPPSSQEHN